MRRRVLGGAGLVAMFVAGLAFAGVIPGIAGTVGTTTQSSGFTTGGPAADFTYDGQTISHADYGRPWTGRGVASQAGWVQTPLSFACQDGTLALTPKVTADAMTVSGDTASFAAPDGAVIVGVLWKSGRGAQVTGATWVEDGSAATVTLSKPWGASRIFVCVPEPTGTLPGSNPLSNPSSNPSSVPSGGTQT